MNTKKSKIASSVLDGVKAIFRHAEYKKSPAKVAAYCQWAFRIDGPAYCEIPTPIDCMFKRGHPQYIAHTSLTFIEIIILTSPHRNLVVFFVQTSLSLLCHNLCAMLQSRLQHPKSMQPTYPRLSMYWYSLPYVLIVGLYLFAMVTP